MPVDAGHTAQRRGFPRPVGTSQSKRFSGRHMIGTMPDGSCQFTVSGKCANLSHGRTFVLHSLNRSRPDLRMKPERRLRNFLVLDFYGTQQRQIFL